MIAHLFALDFMRNAFIAGTIVAVFCGVVGYFVIVRGVTFAAHALSHIGFAGATGAVVLGAPAVAGLFILSLGASLVIGALGETLRSRDVAVGVVLSWTLGLGVLFLALYSGYATEAYALLFGAILGIGTTSLFVTAATALVALVAILAMYRPLLFASLDGAAAEARGVPIRALSIAFMLVLAVAVSAAAQVVGILLVFTLLVTPAATAALLTDTPETAIAVSVAVAVAATWSGLLLAYIAPYPPTFFVATVAFAAYLAAHGARRCRERRRRFVGVGRAEERFVGGSA